MPEARASGGNSRCSPWRDLSSGSECGGRERLVARTAYGWAMVLKPSAAPACALRGDSSRWSVLCPTLIVIPAAASVGTVHRCAQDKLRDHRNLRSRIVEGARRPTKRPHDLARLADPHSTPLRFAQGRLFDKLRCRLQDKPADRRREISPLRDEMTKRPGQSSQNDGLRVEAALPTSLHPMASRREARDPLLSEANSLPCKRHR